MDLFGDLPAPETTEQPKDEETALLEGGSDVESEHSNASSGDVGHKRRSEAREEEDEPMTKMPHLDGPKSCYYGLRSCAAERRGERDDMQDAHVIMEDCSKHFGRVHDSIGRMAYFAVFDGHNGARASKHAAQNMHKHIAAKFPQAEIKQVEKEIKKCFIEAYKRTDEEFLRSAAKVKPVWKDGSTATTILVLNNTLYIANLADSRAVLARYNEEQGKLTALQLTKDHDPSEYSERMRIQKAGGVVRDGRVMGVLEVSRSLGDGQYKNHGVSCLPDVRRCALTSSDKFLIIACDGLWKAFKNQEAVDFVQKTLQNEKLEGTAKRSAADVRLETACSELANAAVRNFSGDNVSVILVRIDSS